MGNKIFISYKYADNNVYQQYINGEWTFTVRDYVNVLQGILGKEHINKGERDNEDLSYLTDTSIENRIKPKIWDSSVTIVMISPKMKEENTPENKQWIPWEISYSLRPVQRDNRTSQRNAIIAIVLPDYHGSYDYAIEVKGSSSVWKTDTFFPIIRGNMFNLKNKEQYRTGNDTYRGEVSYISLIRWNDFCANPNKHIEAALKRQNNIDAYNLTILPKSTVC